MREKVDSLELRPRASIVDQMAVGADPVIMLTGPIPTTQKMLKRNGMTSTTSICSRSTRRSPRDPGWHRELNADIDRMNVNGGAIALGHPVGATGARLISTMVDELERSDKEIGLVAMCCGGGLGTGTLMQRV